MQTYFPRYSENGGKSDFSGGNCGSTRIAQKNRLNKRLEMWIRMTSIRITKGTNPKMYSDPDHVIVSEKEVQPEIMINSWCVYSG